MREREVGVRKYRAAFTLKRTVMAIYRTDKKGNYTIVDNTYLRDSRLSLKTKGLFTIILSLPDDWDFSIGGLCATVHEEEYTIKKALRELKAAGYSRLIRIPPSKETGQRFTYQYDFYENPLQVVSLSVETLSVEPLSVEPLSVENRTIYKSTNLPTTYTPSTSGNKCLTVQTPPLSPLAKPSKRKNKIQEVISEEQQEVIDYFNANRGNMPEYTVLLADTAESINASLAQYGMDVIKQVIMKAKNNALLQGEVTAKDGRPFITLFDWFIKPETIAKIINNTYEKWQKPPKTEEEQQWYALWDEIEGKKKPQ